MSEITNYELERWCNCFNFPYQKCDECKLILGDLTHLKDGETFSIKE